MSETKERTQRIAAAAIAPTCGSCRYFLRAKIGLPAGVCRARPPQLVFCGMINDPVHGVQANVQTFFPQMLDGGWCGDHVPRLAANIDLSTLTQEEIGGEG